MAPQEAAQEAAQEAVTSTQLGQYLKHLSTGKVRELYEIDDETILFVATDRVSAFDVILDNGIADKGALLTRLTAHWFSILTAALPALQTHFLSLDLPAALTPTDAPPALSAAAATARGRSMQVRKLTILPIESIVRGYLTGSAWLEYTAHGTMHGTALPAGLQECAQLPEPVWTPSTKAAAGDKDENISAARAAQLLGSAELADTVARLSLQIYAVASAHAAARGVIIADTKFEFGLDESTTPPRVVLVDEVLTPDSSRFWDAGRYVVGRPQESMDKQVLRDWLVAEGLKGKQGVRMPDEVVRRTRDGYLQAYERLTGNKWEA